MKPKKTSTGSAKEHHLNKGERNSRAVLFKGRADEFADPAVLTPDERLSRFGRLLLRAIERHSGKPSGNQD